MSGQLKAYNYTQWYNHCQALTVLVRRNQVRVKQIALRVQLLYQPCINNKLTELKKKKTK